MVQTDFSLTPDHIPMLDIHRILLRRLLLSWLLVSAIIGGGLYWHGIETIDDQLVGLAVAGANRLTPAQVEQFGAPQPDQEALQRLAGEFLRQHFIVVEFYDREHRKLAERVDPRHVTIEEALKDSPHRFPYDDQPHYQRIAVGEHRVLQVLVPLRDQASRITGYFEGVFLIDPAVLQRLYQSLTVSVLTTLAAVLLTTLAIYPVVLSLNRDVIRYSHDLLRGNIELMEVLGGAIALRDSDTSAHNYRVAIYAVRLAQAAGLEAPAIRSLITGAFLHDVGKIGISDNILLKPARLSPEEFAVMKTHVALGVAILKKSNWLDSAREVVEYHHEKFDGSGYLCGLRGPEIPVAARIFAIVDVFDALTSRRPYKEPMSFDVAMDIIRQDAGSHFDPELTERFDAIAETLFREVSGVPESLLEQRLQGLLTGYFFQGRG
jgi:HD-GYP domain-containing protein (c-di-GMP phosphodiesterase class II)